MNTFAEAIAAIPYAPQSSTATGLLAPIMRACGHILYLVGLMAEPAYDLTDEEAQRELTDASEHLSRTLAVIADAPLSGAAKNRIGAFILAVGWASTEWQEWPEDERGNNLTALAHRATALAAFLDREFIAINADPGRTL